MIVLERSARDLHGASVRLKTLSYEWEAATLCVRTQEIIGHM